MWEKSWGKKKSSKKLKKIVGKKWCEKSGKKIKTVEKNTVEKKLGEKISSKS